MAAESPLHNLGLSLKSLAKMALKARPLHWPKTPRTAPLMVLGNGPSLTDTLASRPGLVADCDLMAVNFAALAPEFQSLRPRWYVLADPHFFSHGSDLRVERLWSTLASATWELTLLVPRESLRSARRRLAATAGSGLRVMGYNAVGVEGWGWLEHMAYASGLGMPRPRNVLIPALMCALRLGYTRIWLAGADHSWMRTLSVDNANRVVSVQPHFYTDPAEEQQRIDAVYEGVRLHDVIHSFYTAFRAYHRIARHARRLGVDIVNITPGSMIDAFPRG